MHNDALPTFRTLGDAWVYSLGQVVQLGSVTLDDSARLLEILNLSLLIDRVTDDDPIIAEFAEGSRIELMCRKYSDLAPVPPYPISYGALLYDNQGVNQVESIIDRLRRKPETKSATFSLHSPHDVHLSCLSLVDCKLRDDRLVLNVVYRSQNVFASQPGNLIALSRVHRSIATAIGVQVGETVLHVLSAHIYESDWNAAKDVLSQRVV
jgi:thymidylate synthase